MTTYEQDSDVVQWGLRLFESDPYANCGYIGTVTQDDYEGQYFNEALYETGNCNVEHDELIAYSLQEELSQLAVSEEAESPDTEQKHLQMSNFQRDWLGESVGNYSPGQDGYHEDVDGMEPSSSCSSFEEKLHNANDWSYSLEFTDQFTLDGEVGRRLNQMVPVPHVPRINGEIPSLDEATLDHQRLLDRLQVYDLVECKVQGDGNCQFRALSDQFYQTPELHEFVRQQVVEQLESCPETYEGYVPMAYGDYLEKMSKSGEWGDHVTLQAAADSYGVKILVITSFKDTCYIEILPSVERSNQVITLSFWAEVHYNSIYPLGEVVSAFETKKNKRWRMHRNKQHVSSQDICQ